MIISNRVKFKIKELVSNNCPRSILLYVDKSKKLKNTSTMRNILLRFTGAERLMENANDTVCHARQQMRDITLGLQVFAWLCVIICIYDLIAGGFNFGFTDAYGFHYSISSRTVWGAVDAFFYAIVTMAMKEAWPYILPQARRTKISIIIMFEDILMLLPFVKKPWEIIFREKWQDNCVIIDDSPLQKDKIIESDIPEIKFDTSQEVISDYFTTTNKKIAIEDDWHLVA